MKKIINNFKTEYIRKINSGELKQIKNTTFKKFTIEMLYEVLKEKYEKRKKNNSSNYVITNSQISDEFYTWNIVMDNK